MAIKAGAVSSKSMKDVFASLEQSKHDMEKLRKTFSKTATATRRMSATMSTTSTTLGYSTFGPTTGSGLVGTNTTPAYSFTPTGWTPFCAFCLVREDDNADIPQAATQIDGTALCRECARQVLNIIEEED